jgi:Zn finger protein HypA/HybF involved in hydrogenase expression
MKCWHCNEELIWGGDHDIEEEDEKFSMVTNLSCPKCESHVRNVYLPKEGGFKMAGWLEKLMEEDDVNNS